MFFKQVFVHQPKELNFDTIIESNSIHSHFD